MAGRDREKDGMQDPVLRVFDRPERLFVTTQNRIRAERAGAGEDQVEE